MYVCGEWLAIRVTPRSDPGDNLCSRRAASLARNKHRSHPRPAKLPDLPTQRTDSYEHEEAEIHHNHDSERTSPRIQSAERSRRVRATVQATGVQLLRLGGQQCRNE